MENRLKILREKLELNQEDFGKKVGLTKSSISNLEAGRYNVSEMLILLISYIFNVNQEWIKTGKGEIYNNTIKEEHLKLIEHKKLTEKDIEFILYFMDLKVKEKENLYYNIKDYINIKEKNMKNKLNKRDIKFIEYLINSTKEEKEKIYTLLEYKR